MKRLRDEGANVILSVGDSGEGRIFYKQNKQVVVRHSAPSMRMGLIVSTINSRSHVLDGLQCIDHSPAPVSYGPVEDHSVDGEKGTRSFVWEKSETWGGTLGSFRVVGRKYLTTSGP